MNAITIKRTAMDLTFHAEIGDVTTLAGEHFVVSEGTPITIAQYRFNGSRLLVHVCPPHTAVQGWAWVFTDMLTEERPEFPTYTDAQGREHAEY